MFRMIFPTLLLCVSPLAAVAIDSDCGACDSRPSDSLGRGWFGCPTQDPGTLFRWNCQSCDAGVSGLDEPLVTDRPDFTEASSVVGLGVLQLETGYTYFRDDEGGSRSTNHSFPETLFRYGVLAEWLEFRFAWNYADGRENGVNVEGAEDIYLGFKIGLTAQDGIRPEMAIIPQMTVPSGASGLSDDQVLAGANWLYGWDLSDCLSTAGSTQVNRAIDGVSGQAYTEWAQSWTLGYSLAERLGAYTEWYALFPSGADSERTEHYFNGGFTFLISNDIQWDIRSGTGLNRAADNFFVGTGVSIRFR